jgi:hypothetical protein
MEIEMRSFHMQINLYNLYGVRILIFAGARVQREPLHGAGQLARAPGARHHRADQRRPRRRRCGPPPALPQLARLGL